jgi:hypothetical protein
MLSRHFSVSVGEHRACQIYLKNPKCVFEWNAVIYVCAHGMMEKEIFVYAYVRVCMWRGKTNIRNRSHKKDK